MGDQLSVKARLVQLTISGDEENPADRSFTLHCWTDGKNIDELSLSKILVPQTAYMELL